jgi:hypothetical protein
MTGRPFIHATIDRPSGLHELWLMRKGADGFMEPLAGPAPWPKGWIELNAQAMDATGLGALMPTYTQNLVPAPGKCGSCGHPHAVACAKCGTLYESEAHQAHGACRTCQTATEPNEATLLHRAVTAEAELERLRAVIDTPHIEQFHDAVRMEAAHQQERWGADHDEGKAPAEWFWLLGHLASKALAALAVGDRVKGLHHVISSAAVLQNWHRHASGEASRMRPGIEKPKHQENQQ